METFRKAQHFLASDKPSTAVTDWIERLCGERYQEDDLEGIAELVDSINLQSTGPTEASRAVRKKMKYGNVHRQLRSLTARFAIAFRQVDEAHFTLSQILKALVENCGTRFATTFANERLLDRIKIMSGDPMTDPRVKKKLLGVVASWHRQFKDDPKMSLVSGLYLSLKPASNTAYLEQQKRHEEEARLRQQERREDKDRKRRKAPSVSSASRTKRRPTATFDFEKEKPAIMKSVADLTHAANGLINALQHVNRETESVKVNPAVQTHLSDTKLYRKSVVRYIQQVESDPSGTFIGTLISTNELAVDAIHLYDRLCRPVELDSDSDGGGGEAKRTGPSVETELDRLQVRQRREIERVNSNRGAELDLSAEVKDSGSLQPPIRPGRPDDEAVYDPGNLSDFSDYDSEDSGEGSANQRETEELDPFADPVEEIILTPGIVERNVWREV